MGKMRNFFSKIEGIVTSDGSVTPQRRRLLGVLFLVLAIICGSLYIVKPYWGLGDTEVKIVAPNIIHCFAGIMLCAPLYVRNFIVFERITPYRMICFFLNIYTFSLIMVFVLGQNYSISNKFTTIFLFGAILLSWLGIRSIAGFVWILFFVFGILNSLVSAAQLGFFGTLFLLFGMASIFFQANATPKLLFAFFKEEFRGFDQTYGKEVKGSVNASVDLTKEVTSKFI